MRAAFYGLLAAGFLAGTAAAKEVDIDAFLSRHCKREMGRLSVAADANFKCNLAKAAELDASESTDTEIAAMAIKACADTEATVREVIAACAGARLNEAMDSYEISDFADVIRALVRGTEAATAKTTPAAALFKAGALQDALVDHLGCMTVSGAVADTESDRAMALAQATQNCAALGVVLEQAIQAGLGETDSAIAQRYARSAAVDRALREFDAALARAKPPEASQGSSDGTVANGGGGETALGRTKA